MPVTCVLCLVCLVVTVIVIIIQCVCMCVCVMCNCNNNSVYVCVWLFVWMCVCLCCSVCAWFAIDVSFQFNFMKLEAYDIFSRIFCFIENNLFQFLIYSKIQNIPCWTGKKFEPQIFNMYHTLTKPIVH